MRLFSRLYLQYIKIPRVLCGLYLEIDNLNLPVEVKMGFYDALYQAAMKIIGVERKEGVDYTILLGIRGQRDGVNYVQLLGEYMEKLRSLVEPCIHN